MSDISLIFDFLLDMFSNIAILYTTSVILGGVIALWVLSKIINLIRRLLP